jgi:hypothetical protein
MKNDRTNPNLVTIMGKASHNLYKWPLIDIRIISFTFLSIEKVEAFDENDVYNPSCLHDVRSFKILENRIY